MVEHHARPAVERSPEPDARSEQKPVLIYIASLKGAPMPQVWHEGGPNQFSDYWNERRAGVRRIVGEPTPIDVKHLGLPLRDLARLYPPPATAETGQ